MRIIFLDYDGVLVPFKAPGKKARPAIADPDCVSRLNAIVRATGAGIVVISDWRKSTSVKKLEECHEKWGMVGKIVGTTPIRANRALEILDWAANNQDVLPPDDKFVILDDGDLQIEEQVLIDPMKGLSTKDMLEAINKLGEKHESFISRL